MALGYQLPSNWRAEVEYTLPKRNEFTSGSTNFPTSFNHHKIRSQRPDPVDTQRMAGDGHAVGDGLHLIPGEPESIECGVRLEDNGKRR